MKDQAKTDVAAQPVIARSARKRWVPPQVIIATSSDGTLKTVFSTIENHTTSSINTGS